MKHNARRVAVHKIILSVVGVAMSLFCLQVSAQTFPNKPIRWLLGYPAGSGLDFMARVVSESMSKDLGQPIIIDNKPGAAGAIGAAALASAPADGYTMLSMDIGTYSFNPHIYHKLTYDPLRDFQMAGMIATMPMMMVVPSSLNVSTVGEFVAYVKAQPPGSVNFASSGLGGPQHMSAEVFQRRAGLNMVHVPYKGSPPAIADVAGGTVSLMFVDPNTPMPMVQSGKLRYLGVAMPTRVGSLPSVPTMREAGYDVDFPAVWVGLAVAKGTPPAALDRINRALGVAMADPQVMKRLADAGFVVSDRWSARQADDFARSQHQEWGKKLAPLNLRLD